MTYACAYSEVEKKTVTEMWEGIHSHRHNSKWPFKHDTKRAYYDKQWTSENRWRFKQDF